MQLKGSLPMNRAYSPTVSIPDASLQRSEAGKQESASLAARNHWMDPV